MNRRTFDIGVPLLYLVAIIVAIIAFHDDLIVGAVTTIGAFLVALYFGALRPKSKV